MFKKFAIYYLTILTIAFGFSLLPTSITRLAEDFQRTPERLDWVLSMLFLGFLIAVAVCTFYADRLGKDRLILLGLLSMCLSLFIGSFVTILPFFILPGLLLGLGLGFVEISATACVSERASEENRLQVMNLGQAFFCVGTVVGPILVGVMLSEGVHWRLVFRLMGGMTFLIALVFAKFAWRSLARPYETGNDPLQPEVSPLGLLRDKGFLMLAAGMFLFVVAEGGYAGWSCAYFVETLNSPLWFGGLMLSTFWVGEAAGRLLLAFWRPRMAESRLIMWFYVVALIGGTPLVLIENHWIGFFCLLLAGGGLSIVWPTIVAIVGKNYPEKGSAAFSVIIGAGALGGLFSGPVVGRVTGWSGSFRLGMAMPLAIMLASVFLFARLSGRVRR